MCSLQGGLQTASLQEHTQKNRTHHHAAQRLDALTTTARKELGEQLHSRLFELRPSNWRLVQCYMSKQAPAAAFLSADQLTLARTLYLKALRDAVAIARGAAVVTPPSPKPRMQNLAPSGSKIFRGIGSVLFPALPSPADGGDDATHDPVAIRSPTRLIKGWADIALLPTCIENILMA